MARDRFGESCAMAERAMAKKGIKVNAGKVIEVKSGAAGLKTWSAIDFLVNYCGCTLKIMPAHS
jgi:hypothetical protein